MTDQFMLSIVIPVFNEAGALGETLALTSENARLTGLPHEIVLVDDGSTDGTWDVIQKYCRDFQEIKGIKLSRNFGKESAVATGLEFAAGDAVIVMDGDGQHPPAMIPEMVKCWKEEKFDVVEAVKEDRGNERFALTVGARLFYWLMKRLTDLNLDDSSDFKLLDRKVVDAHNLLPESSRFFRGIVSWLGFRKKQIPFSVGERIKGRSSWTLLGLVRLALHASTSFSSFPLHIITIMGTVTLGVSVILGIQTLYMKFSGNALSGFTTVILLLLFIGSILMISIGIIGVYIGRIFEEVKKRPKFIVEQTLNFKNKIR